MSSNPQSRWILAATILASSMAFIDGTVVNVALPALQKDLQATAIGVQWVVEAYALLLSALLLVGGSLGDHYGRRRVFLIGVSIFAAASAWCGLAPSIEQLIAARAVQGIGGALLIPGSLAIISASFSAEKRGRAIGTWSGFSAITTAIGPVLGGWLVENASWRAVFFINLPLAVAVIVISLRHITESRDRRSGSIDWIGAALATLGLGGLTYGLIDSSRLGWGAASVVISVALGVVILAVFILMEAKLSSPMLPLSLFRSRNFTATNLLTLMLYFSLSGGLFFLTLNLIQVQDFSATAAGAALLPFVILMFVLSRWSGGLIERLGPRAPLTLGPIVAGAGYFLMTLPGIQANYWKGFLPGVLVLGLGMAISVAPLTTTVMSSVSESQAGVASGINNAVSRAAGLLAVAVLGVVMLQVFSVSLRERLDQISLPTETRAAIYDQRIKLAGLNVDDILTDKATASTEAKEKVRSAIRESFVSGFRILMLIAAAMAIAGGITSWVLIENRKP